MTTPVLPTDSTAYYRRTGPNSYQPTIHVQGAWRDDEQHMSPVSGLIVNELTRHQPRPDLQLSRVTFEILGVIPAVESHLEVTTIRPGRTIELLEAVLSAGGRPAVRARAWRLSTQDTTRYAGVELPAMAPPDQAVPIDCTQEWPGGYIRSMQARELPGGRPGRRKVWVRSNCELIEGEDADPTAEFIVLIDGANGMATRLRPTERMFPNVDLTVHLLRAPTPGWVGLDVAVTFGATGLGVTTTTLNDAHGPVGQAQQSLTVREFPTR